MSNLEKYNKIFMDCFSLTEADLNSDLKYQSIPAWDSVGHVNMIAEMEDEYSLYLNW